MDIKIYRKRNQQKCQAKLKDRYDKIYINNHSVLK